MDNRVKGGNGVKACWLKIQGCHVGLKKSGIGYIFSGKAHLPHRKVNPRDVKAFSKCSCRWNTCSTPKFKHMSTNRETFQQEGGVIRSIILLCAVAACPLAVLLSYVVISLSDNAFWVHLLSLLILLSFLRRDPIYRVP